MKKFLLSLLLAGFYGLLMAQSVTPSASVYQYGDDIVINFDGSTAALDWVGIYKEGQMPDPGNGGVASTAWFYTNETQDGASATTVIPSGSLTFEDDLPGGNYIVHLLCCDGYTIMASGSFSVEGGGPTPGEIYIDNFALFGGTISFSFAGGTGSPEDWIGIYNKGVVPGGGESSLQFQYVPGPEGSLSFDLGGANPLPVGEYDAHLLCCNGYDILASTQFEIFEPLAPSIEPANLLMETQPLKFNFTGGTGSLSDWVGIYDAGVVPDGDPASIDYKYVGGANGQVVFDPIAELVPGNLYDAHLFCCDGYDILASHTNFTVQIFNSTGEVVMVPAMFSASAPAQGTVRLTFNEVVNGMARIFNMTGQAVANRTVAGEGTMDVAGLQAGTYAVMVQGEKRAQTVKVVVH